MQQNFISKLCENYFRLNLINSMNNTVSLNKCERRNECWLFIQSAERIQNSGALHILHLEFL